MSPSIKKWLGALGVLTMLATAGGAHAQTNGLRGYYYDIDTPAGLGRSQPNRGLLFGCRKPLFSEVDEVVDNTAFTDLPGDPGGALGDLEGFGAKWVGTLTATATEDRFISGGSDDGIRVWLKDQADGPIKGTDAPTVDAWVDRGDAETLSATAFHFTTGHKYSVIVEFYENGGGNAAHLRWRTTEEGAVSEVIPTEVLTPDPEITFPADNVAPGAPGAITVSDITFNSAKLTFTAPGDDAAAGTAGCFEVRYSPGPITDASFTTGTLANIGTTIPDAAGASETLSLGGLQQLDHYYVGIRAGDDAGNFGPIAIVQFDTPVAPPPVVPANGVFTEFFRNRAGTCVDTDFKQDPNVLADLPSDTAFYPNFEMYGVDDVTVLPGGDIANQYGARMRAFFTPPKTGDYQFWIATDDDGELAISPVPKDDPTFDAAKLTVLAGNPGCDWAGIRDYNKHSNAGTPNEEDPAANSVSKPVTLTAGKAYLVQGIAKEDGGGDNLAVAASDPDGNIVGTTTPFDGTQVGALGPTPIAKQFLTPYVPPAQNFGRVHVLVTSGGKPVANARVEVTDVKGVNNYGSNAGGVVSKLSAPGAVTAKVTAPDPFTAALTPTPVVGTTTAETGKVKDITISLPDIPAEAAGSVSLKPADPVSKAVWTLLPTPDRTHYEIDNPDTEAVETDPNYAVVDADFMSLTAAQTAADQSHAGSGATWIATTRVPGDVETPDADPTDDIVADNTWFAYAAHFNVPAGFKGDATQFAIVDFNFDDNLHSAYLNNTKVQSSATQTATLPGVNIWDRVWSFMVPAASIKEGDGAANINHLVLVGFQGGGGAGYTNGNLNMRLVKYGGGGVPPPGCKGDANADSKVDVNDAVAVLRHATGIALLTGQARINADINGDGSTDAGVNVEDAVKVLQYIVGIPNTGITGCQ